MKRKLLEPQQKINSLWYDESLLFTGIGFILNDEGWMHTLTVWSGEEYRAKKIIRIMEIEDGQEIKNYKPVYLKNYVEGDILYTVGIGYDHEDYSDGFIKIDGKPFSGLLIEGDLGEETNYVNGYFDSRSELGFHNLLLTDLTLNAGKHEFSWIREGAGLDNFSRIMISEPRVFHVETKAFHDIYDVDKKVEVDFIKIDGTIPENFDYSSSELDILPKNLNEVLGCFKLSSPYLLLCGSKISDDILFKLGEKNISHIKKLIILDYGYFGKTLTAKGISVFNNIALKKIKINLTGNSDKELSHKVLSELKLQREDILIEISNNE